MQQRIRILIGDMPWSLQHDLVAAIATQPDMEVVGDTGCRGVALLLEVRRVAPNAVVLGSDDGELRAELSQLLGEFPEIEMVGVIAGNPPDECLAIRRAGFSGNSREHDLLNLIRSAIGIEISSQVPDGLKVQEKAENPWKE